MGHFENKPLRETGQFEIAHMKNDFLMISFRSDPFFGTDNESENPTLDFDKKKLVIKILLLYSSQ